MKNIIFISPPAAGKGTQSILLEKEYGYVHISTGDMLRSAVRSGSELGCKVKALVDRGLLVDDDIVLDLIREKLSELDGKSFILDGVPRTIYQAGVLDDILEENNIDYIVVFLAITEDMAIERAVSRITCGCGRTYNLRVAELMPKVAGICDDCGKALVVRKDDNADDFRKRFREYEESTEPLVEYYQRKNKLVVIDASQDTLKILGDITGQLENNMCRELHKESE